MQEEVGSEFRVTLVGPGERFMAEVDERPAWAEGLNERQVEAVLYVGEHGRIRRKEYVELMLLSSRTAARDLSELVSRGILSLCGAGRGSYYVLSTRDVWHDYGTFFETTHLHPPWRQNVMRDDLRQELVTRELFEERMKVIDERFNMVDERFKSMKREMNERFNMVDERFSSLNFKLNLFIAIALLALTLANPTFAALVGRLFP